jgi:16S rRNA processing protein RimM
MVQVGFVFRAHGMEGELKVNPEHTDDPARFEELDTVYLGRSPRAVTRHEIASVRYQETKRGTTVILGLADVASRSDAEAVMKQKVFADEADLELADDEIFIHDLVGLSVVTEAGETLGTVANYMEMPAQDVFVVHRPEAGEAMIPAVEDFIVDIDLDGGRLVVRPIEGLLD